MFYYFQLTSFPIAKKIVTVTRNTVWQIADQSHLLIHIEDGCCEFSFDEETFIVRQGDLLYIPANHSYTRRPIDGMPCTMTYIHFSMSNNVVTCNASSIFDIAIGQKNKLNDLMLYDTIHSQHSYALFLKSLFHFENTDHIADLYSTIRQTLSSRHFMSPLQTSINLCHLLALLSEMTLNHIISDPELQNTPEMPPRLKHALLYISQHYTRALSLAELAVHCNISKQQMIRDFKQYLHTTPGNYILDFKIARAKESLFYHPETSIKEIANELGFDDQHYFARVFQKATGETPSKYRTRTIQYHNQNHF